MSNDSNGFITQNIHSIIFPDENKICYWQDFSRWEGIPSNLFFYPEKEINGSIVFIGDGYGILNKNKYNLSGEYGNGAIYVSIEHLPADIVKWCRSNLLNQQQHDQS